ncbi:CelD/BcsL family acetyltransferase involved in cellulose biosynthesis [Paraburkholderia youngii]
MRVEIIDGTDPERIAEAVNALFVWKRAWAARVGKHGPWLYSEHYRNFLVSRLTTDDRSVKSHAIIVTVDDAMVAVLFMFTDARAVNEIISGFDPDFSKWAPGLLAIESMVKWAFDHQSDLDCGPGSEAFKPYWSRNNLRSCCTAVSVNSAWGLAALLLRRWPRNAVNSVRALMGHSGAPQIDRSAQTKDGSANSDLTEEEPTVN